MVYFGSEMLSVGRAVIRAICARNNGWNVFHQLRESFDKGELLCWCGAILLFWSSDSLGPGKINFLDRRKQSLLHRVVYQARISPNK